MTGNIKWNFEGLPDENRTVLLKTRETEIGGIKADGVYQIAEIDHGECYIGEPKGSFSYSTESFKEAIEKWAYLE